MNKTELAQKLAKKTEDLLNEHGAEGWEFVSLSATSLILKRVVR